MKNAFKRPAILLTLICLFAINAFAWDDVGHKIAAYIGWQTMTPAARQRAFELLTRAPEDSQLAAFYIKYGPRSDEVKQREFFMLAATWPDMVRDDKFPVRSGKYHHPTWHYSDTYWRSTGTGIEILRPGERDGFALEKIAEYIALEGSGAGDAEKALGVAWLEHLIGDIHQPLHTSARVTDLEPNGDHGAGLFSLTPKDAASADKLDLHWFWDSVLVRTVPNTKMSDPCDADYIENMARKFMKMYPYSKLKAGLHSDDTEVWRKEGFEIATTRVFPATLKRNELPALKYRLMARDIAEKRLALAGYRMGEIFNRIFG